VILAFWRAILANGKTMMATAADGSSSYITTEIRTAK